MNGAQCCLKYIQLQDNNSDFPAIIWVKFEDECIGSEQHKKYSYLVNRKQVKSGHQFLHKRGHF